MYRRAYFCAIWLTAFLAVNVCGGGAASARRCPQGMVRVGKTCESSTDTSPEGENNGSPLDAVRVVLSARLCVYQLGLREATRRPSDDIEKPETWRMLINHARDTLKDAKLSATSCGNQTIRVTMGCLPSVHGILNIPLACNFGRYQTYVQSDQALPVPELPLSEPACMGEYQAHERAERLYAETSETEVDKRFERGRDTHKTREALRDCMERVALKKKGQYPCAPEKEAMESAQRYLAQVKQENRPAAAVAEERVQAERAEFRFNACETRWR